MIILPLSIGVNLNGELNMLNNVMALNEDDAPERLELASAADNDEAKLEARRESLLRAANSSQLNTIKERVAWLLNQFPKTRDSDITLQIRYWQNFQSDRFGGGEIAVSDYYRLANIPSRIQPIVRSSFTVPESKYRPGHKWSWPWRFSRSWIRGSFDRPCLADSR